MPDVAHEGQGYVVPEWVKEGQLVIFPLTGKVFRVTAGGPGTSYTPTPEYDHVRSERTLKEHANLVGAIVLRTTLQHVIDYRG